MAKRIISAIFGILFLIGIIWVSTFFSIIIDILIALICAVAVGEFTNATNTLKLYYISIPSIAFAFVYPMLVSYNMWYILWYVYTFFMLTLLVFMHRKVTYKDFASVYGMTIIITVALSSIILMKDNDIAHGSVYFVISMAIPWLADGGAYFIGSFFGKHKLCPEISPKKTVEGAIGGIVVCVALTCIVVWLFAIFLFSSTVKLNYGNLIVMSLIASVLSIIGDLSFSLVKRTYNIKDYGNLIPGHGGVLDRFDSVMFVAPFLYIAVSYFPIISI